MKSIYVRLAGGLGNQLFQIAYGLLVCKMVNGKLVLCRSSLGTYATKRHFTLPDVLDLGHMRVAEPLLPFLVFKSRFALISSFLPPNFGFISDRNCQKILEVDHSLPNIFLDGYFNRSINQAIFEEMVTCVSLLYKGRLTRVRPKICVIHVRGGDFIKLGLARTEDSEFYRAAVEEVRRLVPDIVFEVVTDDFQFAQTILEGICDVKEISKASVSDDFIRLSTAEFAIISDSTFALWARAIKLSDTNIDRTTFSRKMWEPGVRRAVSFFGEQLP